MSGRRIEDDPRMRKKEPRRPSGSSFRRAAGDAGRRRAVVFRAPRWHPGRFRPTRRAPGPDRAGQGASVLSDKPVASRGLRRSRSATPGTSSERKEEIAK
jgi:hypothetical protein